MKSIKIRIRDNKILPYLKKQLFATRHFENIYLILLHQDFKQNNSVNRKALMNTNAMKALIRGTLSQNHVATVQQLRTFYAGNKLMEDLIKVSKSLKIHNLGHTMDKIRAEYKGYFTKRQNGDVSAQPPRPKKLSKMANYTVKLDSVKSFTFKPKRKKKKYLNKIGLNLSDAMRYTQLNHKSLEKIVGSLDNICSVDINYTNGNVYLNIAYEEQPIHTAELPNKKYAGMDPGLNNLVSLYVEDDTTQSLIVDGTPYKAYNSSFNRFIAKLSNDIDTLQDKKRVQYLKKYRQFLYEKRNNYFSSEFHNIATRILAYLQKHGVTHLVTSRNLVELKNNGNLEMYKKTRQSFIQIPFISLIDKIADKAWRYGITVEYVDEAYTSKTSSISADVIEIQKKAKRNRSSVSTDDFGGSRVKRGLYKDRVVDKVVNADINGARNICMIGQDRVSLLSNLWKLCNPKKIKSDTEFLRVLRNREVG